MVTLEKHTDRIMEYESEARSSGYESSTGMPEDLRVARVLLDGCPVDKERHSPGWPHHVLFALGVNPLDLPVANSPYHVGGMPQGVAHPVALAAMFAETHPKIATALLARASTDAQTIQRHGTGGFPHYADSIGRYTNDPERVTLYPPPPPPGFEARVTDALPILFFPSAAPWYTQQAMLRMLQEVPAASGTRSILRQIHGSLPEHRKHESANLALRLLQEATKHAANPRRVSEAMLLAHACDSNVAGRYLLDKFKGKAYGACLAALPAASTEAMRVGLTAIMNSAEPRTLLQNLGRQLEVDDVVKLRGDLLQELLWSLPMSQLSPLVDAGASELRSSLLGQLSDPIKLTELFNDHKGRLPANKAEAGEAAAKTAWDKTKESIVWRFDAANTLRDVIQQTELPRNAKLLVLLSHLRGPGNPLEETAQQWLQGHEKLQDSLLLYTSPMQITAFEAKRRINAQASFALFED